MPRCSHSFCSAGLRSQTPWTGFAPVIRRSLGAAFGTGQGTYNRSVDTLPNVGEMAP